MAEMVDLLFMRHGAPAYPSQTYPDPFLMPLSAQGRVEAAAGEAAVKRFSPDMVFSSDFLRAIETADLAAGRLGLAIQPKQELRERVFYSVIGKSFSEIIDEHGEVGRGIIEGNSDLVEVPGEEEYPDARGRVVRFARGLSAVAPGCRVLMVAHGGPHAWLLEETLATDLRGARSISLRTGFFSRFTIRDGRFRLDSMNLPPCGVAR